MPTFAYKAIDKDGKNVSGNLDAPDRKGALRALSAEGLRPVNISEHKDAASAAQESFEASHDYFSKQSAGSDKNGSARDNGSKSELKFKRRKNARVTALGFLQNLLMLIQSGMPMGDSLRLLYNRLGEEDQKELASALWKRISEGRTLSSAMQDFPRYFADSQVQLVAAGEASGQLAVVLEKMVEYMQQSMSARKKFVAGLSYPLFIVGMASVVTLLFIFVLLPIIKGFIENMGSEMHFFAVLLIKGGEMMKWGLPAFIVLAVLLWGSLASWRKSEKGKAKTDIWMLNLPVLSTIYRHQHISQTTMLLATLMDSGVNTPEALRLVERTVSNVVLKGAYTGIRRMIQEGASLSAAIRKAHIFPDMDVDMLAVGENTGTISGSLKRIGEIHRESMEKSMGTLTTVVTTGALFAAFSIVAMIALSIVMSVLDISQSLSY